MNPSLSLISKLPFFTLSVDGRAIDQELQE